MSRSAIYTPEEAKARRNARRVEYQRKRMQDPEYRARQLKMQRDWYAKQPKEYREERTEATRKWREANPHQYRFTSAKVSARHRDIEWGLEPADIDWPTHCPVFGIELDYKRKNTRAPTDDSPSIDRIDATRGYVKGNVVVVSMLANRIKNSGSWEQIMRVAEFYRDIAQAT